MKTPWHVWVVGIVLVVWNGGGAWDYLMSVQRNEGYFAIMPEENRIAVQAYLDGMPTWAVSTWAIGVWFALLGALLILLRSRFAFHATALGLAGLIATSVYSFGMAPPSMMNQMSMGVVLFNAALYLVLILTLVYTRRQTANGHLR